MTPAAQLRKELHQYPALSGDESGTANRIRHFFEPLRPDAIISGIGGHGVAVVFSGQAPGPTVLLRCELDAVPVEETMGPPYRSTVAGTSHKCGHDGHMAILAAVGEWLSVNRPGRGRAVLLYQPAEETGEGAAAVMGDVRFSAVRPDVVFALHNLPGFPLGQIVLRAGTFSCASRGMIVTLRGRTAHAAQPHTGLNPTRAMCRIIESMGALPGHVRPDGEIVFATVVGARLGEGNPFGTAPGSATIFVTLRSETENTMGRLVSHCEATVGQQAVQDGLTWEIAYGDVFLPTINSDIETKAVFRAAGEMNVTTVDRPFPWSEDFGRFTAVTPGALFGIGAGETVADLHDPDYDFPDALIPMGADVFKKILGQYLNL